MSKEFDCSRVSDPLNTGPNELRSKVKREIYNLRGGAGKFRSRGIDWHYEEVNDFGFPVVSKRSVNVKELNEWPTRTEAQINLTDQSHRVQWMHGAVEEWGVYSCHKGLGNKNVGAEHAHMPDGAVQYRNSFIDLDPSEYGVDEDDPKLLEG